MNKNEPLFKSIRLLRGATVHEIAKEVDPVFWLTIGKRDLISQNGWNIFFDKVPLKPYQSCKIDINKTDAAVSSYGSRTVIRVGELTAAHFKGAIEITLYNGSAMFNIAAVVSTEKDSTAIVYDAGLISKQQTWVIFRMLMYMIRCKQSLLSQLIQLP